MYPESELNNFHELERKGREIRQGCLNSLHTFYTMQSKSNHRNEFTRPTSVLFTPAYRIGNYYGLIAQEISINGTEQDSVYFQI
jgi:hypothetical protein